MCCICKLSWNIWSVIIETLQKINTHVCICTRYSATEVKLSQGRLNQHLYIPLAWFWFEQEACWPQQPTRVTWGCVVDSPFGGRSREGASVQQRRRNQQSSLPRHAHFREPGQPESSPSGLLCWHRLIVPELPHSCIPHPINLNMGVGLGSEYSVPHALSGMYGLAVPQWRVDTMRQRRPPYPHESLNSRNMPWYVQYPRISPTPILLASFMSSSGRWSGRVGPRRNFLAKRAARTAPGDRCHPVAGAVYGAEGGDRGGVPRPTTPGGEEACVTVGVSGRQGTRWVHPRVFYAEMNLGGRGLGEALEWHGHPRGALER